MSDATVLQGVLKFGQVGPVFEGEPGSVLTFGPDGRTISGQGSISALSRQFWVDQDAPAGGDGSDERPFNSITDAVAGVVASNYALLLAPYDYSAEPAVTIPAGVTVAFFCFSPQQDGEDPACSLPPLVCDDAVDPCSVLLRAVDCPLLSGWQSTIEIDGASCVFTAGAPGVNPFALSIVARGTRQSVLSGTVDRLEADGVTLGDLATDPAGATAAVLARNCLIDAVTWDVSTASLSLCQFGAGTSLIAETIAWDDYTSRSAAGNGATLASTVTNLTSLSPVNPIYGTGETGDLAIAAGTTAVPDTNNQYANVSITGTAVLEVNRNILRVRDILDLTAAPVNAIVSRLAATRPSRGGNAAGAVGGTAGVAENGWFPGTPGAQGGAAGATGTPAAGTTPAAQTTARYAFGGGSGGSGAAGAGVNAGGPAGVANVTSNARVEISEALGLAASSFVGPPASINDALAAALLIGSQPGRAGGAGGGNGAAAAGGGGGGSPTGAYPLVIFARAIKVGVGTPAACVKSNGFGGGSGGNGVADALATGGGAGAGGSGGGGILIVYDWLIGSGADAGMMTSDGGGGGAGGNGNGSGAAQGGAGGAGGDGGQIITINMMTYTRLRTLGAAGAAGSPAVGNVGGAGGAGGLCAATLG